MKQRYGKESFLVARPAGSPKLVAKAALHATYEALLRGAGCSEASDESSTMWFLDVGTDDDELLALASSLGCGVSVLDPEVKDVRAVDMTRCMNEEPNRPFLVYQVPANNVTNPETLANITRLSQGSGSNVSEHPATSNVSEHPPTSSLIGLAKPTMLNRLKRARALKKSQLSDQKPAEKSAGVKTLNAKVKPVTANGETAHDTSGVGSSLHSVATDEPVNSTAVANTTYLIAAPPAPMESGVMLDTLFARADADSNASGPVEVTAPSGSSYKMDKVSVLKVTPRSENSAALKALQGAHKLLKSGRVQCLVTEMNFDLNYTEALLNYVTELEHLGFHFAHLGSLDYSELEVTDQGQYEVFLTDSLQLRELFDTYKRIRSFDERSGFRVYSGSLSLDRKGHYFDYTNLIFACKQGFPSRLSVLAKGKIRFRNGVWWLEKQKA